MAGLGIVGPQYRGAQGYQFRLSGADFGRELIGAADEGFEVLKTVDLVAALLHRRLYFGWAASGPDDDPDHVLFLGMQGRVGFYREDRLVGEIGIFWSNDTGRALANYLPSVIPTVAPPFAVEVLPSGVPGNTTFVPPHPVHDCGQNVLQIGFSNLQTPVAGKFPGAIIRMWPYQVSVEADRATLELKGAYNLATVTASSGYLRGYLGVYSQDHPF